MLPPPPPLMKLPSEVGSITSIYSICLRREAGDSSNGRFLFLHFLISAGIKEKDGSIIFILSLQSLCHLCHVQGGVGGRGWGDPPRPIQPQKDEVDVF